MISSSSGSLLYTAATALQSGVSHQGSAARQISSAFTTGTGDPTPGVVALTQGAHQVEAGAGLVKTADETLEELINMVTR